VVQYGAYEYSRAFLLTLLVVSLSVGTGMGVGTPSSSPFTYALIYLISLGTALLTVWLAGRFLDRRPFAGFGFHFGGAWWTDFAFGLGLGAALMSAVFCFQLASGWISVTEWFVSPGIGFLVGLIPPLVIFLCTGVSEELVSRGYQLRNGAEGLAGMGMSPRAAVLLAWTLSSVFFGLLHGANPNATAFSIINIVLAGLMLGAGYVLTGELAIPIGLHISWNLFQGTVFGFPVSGIRTGGSSVLTLEVTGPSLWTGGPFGPEGGLLGVLAIVTGCALVILYVRLRRGRTSIEPSIAVAPAPPDASPGSPSRTT
jgi:membrane protease YdiL (CAAX protease family)